DIQLGHHHYNIFSAEVELFQMKMSLLFAYEMSVSGEFPSLQLHVPAMLSTQPLAFKKIK
ncbi:penicillin-binding protein, partial [Bacillus mycoides]